TNMGRHVVGTLVAMAKERIVIRHQAREEPVEVATNIGIGILLNHDTRRGVPNEERQETCLEARLVDPIEHRSRDLEQAASAAFERQGSGELAEWRHRIRHPDTCYFRPG